VERKKEKAYPLKEEESKQEVMPKGDEKEQQRDAIHHCQLGQEYMERGEFFKAISLLEEAITLDSSYREAYLKIGHCHEKLKKYEKAISYYERALELDPSDTEIRYSLGVALQLLGLHREAEKEYMKVLSSDHHNIMARNNLAAVYLQEGKREKAMEEFKKLVESAPHNPHFKSNLKIASGEDRGSRKKKECTKEGISLCMVMRDEGEEVKEFFNLVTPWVDEIIVIDTGLSGEGIKAAKDFGVKVVYHPWEEDFSGVRNVSLEHASSEWILVLDTDEYISKEGFSYLRSLIGNEDFEAFRFIQRNYVDNPSLSWWVPCSDRVKQAWNCSGWIPSYPVKLFKNHEEIFFEGMIKESVDRSLYRRKGKIGKANVLIHHSDYSLPPEKRIVRERNLLQLGKKQLALTPGDHDVCYDLALRHAQLNELDQAVASFRKLMHLLPDNYSVYNDLGNVYCEKGAYQEAKDFYLNSLRVEPRFFQANYNLANLHLLAGELDKSWDAYHRALEIYPECAHIYNNLGIICEKRGEDEEAIKHCEHAISLNPFLPQAYNNLGVLYNKKGDGVRAEESFLKAIELNGAYVEAYGNLGNLHLREGEKDKAEKMFAEARKYTPAMLDAKDVQPFNAETAEKSAWKYCPGN
jgi:tetratricopeptide (TPR) repeat protein